MAVLAPLTTQLLEPSRRVNGMVASAAAAPSEPVPMPARSSPGAGSSGRCGSVGQSASSRSAPIRVSSWARSTSSSALPVIASAPIRWSGTVSSHGAGVMPSSVNSIGGRSFTLAIQALIPCTNARTIARVSGA